MEAGSGSGSKRARHIFLLKNKPGSFVLIFPLKIRALFFGAMKIESIAFDFHGIIWYVY